jgi:hypothetical protein
MAAQKLSPPVMVETMPVTTLRTCSTALASDSVALSRTARLFRLTANRIPPAVPM